MTCGAGSSNVRIAFVLPGAGSVPVGGFKVVYEYANRLAERGHTVTVVHTAQPDRQASRGEKLKKGVRFVQRKLDQSYRPDWFTLDPNVSLLWRATPAAGGVPDADTVVATAWQTAEWVADYPAVKGKKFYLIQHYETWSGPKERVDATFRLGLRNLVIARWLEEPVRAQGADAAYLPNGLDFAAFGIDKPLEERGLHAMMLYHDADWKGSADGIKALQLVRAQLPEFQATLFGTPTVPTGLPHWLRYEQTPSPEKLRKLYNDSAIFLATSWTEGWGLPGCEALLCGCALAATDVGGHREYAVNGETALLSPPRDPAALARNVLKLLRDKPLRLRLAEEGHAYVQRFTWAAAVEKLEHELTRNP